MKRWGCATIAMLLLSLHLKAQDQSPALDFLQDVLGDDQGAENILSLDGSTPPAETGEPAPLDVTEPESDFDETEEAPTITPVPTPQPTKAPVVPEPVAVEEPEIQITVTLPPGWEQAQRPGNYQKKAQIFKTAGDIYDQLRKIEPIILKAYEDFFAGRSKLDQQVDDFFYKIGATQNEVSSTIDQLLAELGDEEKDDEDLLEEEREIVLELNQNKADLKQLQENITTLSELSVLLDNALAQIQGLVSMIQGLEDQGWQLYQQIDELFDDQQASDLLGQMKTMLDNGNALVTYVQSPFSQFFSSVQNTISSQMSQITSAVSSLKDRGVTLSKQQDDLEAQEKAREEAEAEAKAAEAAAKRASKPKTWMVKVQEGLANSWQWIKGAAQSLYSKLFGPAALEPAAPVSSTSVPAPVEAPKAEEAPTPTEPETTPAPKPIITTEPAPAIAMPPAIKPEQLPQPPAITLPATKVVSTPAPALSPAS